ncbi:T9SS type A sorting domain-containing protein, partial [candidate division KSB1 bacterium]|nr:T9SS type A sorting domain-containing protein [candidate division KSB1 bacterium]
RGFCADNQTLTNYIWGYLGNEPPDFYPPYLNFDNLSPEPDAMAVDVNSDIFININDDASGIDISSIIIKINNETIYNGAQPDLYTNVSVSGTVHNFLIKYTPSQPLPTDSEIIVSVDVRDLASPPNTMATATYSFMTGTDSDVEEHYPVIITQNRLNQNYPNPFNAGTTIEYELIKSGRIKLQIYNIAGQVIKSLAQGERPKGVHKIHWDGNDDTGNPASSGMYFCKFLTDSFIQFRKIIKLE